MSISNQPSGSSFKILGDDIQAIEFDLAPGAGVKAEAGAMLYMQQGITVDTKFEGGFLGALKRAFVNESLAIPFFTNTSNVNQRVAFSAPYPGKIIPISLQVFGGTLLAQRDSFLCADIDTTIEVAFTKKIGAGFFGGEGFILEKLSGKGMVFVHSGGTIIEKELVQGEILKVDTGCLVAFSESIDYDVQLISGFKNMIFGGEGFFQTVLTGPGKVYLQSLPFSRIAQAIMQTVQGNAGSSESGGALGQLANSFFDRQ